MTRQNSFLDLLNAYLDSGKVSLPPFDDAVQKIQQELSATDPDIGKIEKIITSDQALTGQVLRVANSSFYKGFSKVETVRKAIVRLGIKEVANIAVLVTQKRQFRARTAVTRTVVNELWKHSAGCAIGSHWLAGHCGYNSITHEAFFAGLLHDVGKLLIISLVDKIILSDKIDFKPTDRLLGEIMSEFHAQHGYQLMAMWNLPEEYCTVARDHHKEPPDDGNPLLLMVRLANKACKKMNIGYNPMEEKSLSLTAEPEAAILGLNAVGVAQLEIRLEDSQALSA